jgi:carbon-monoxide dehydrogenase small subunit
LNGAVRINFSLNGSPVSANVRAEQTLVDLLTNEFDLAGARESCGQGLCGCCTVYVDGAPVSGCLYMAAMLNGSEVTTIEQLSEYGGPLHPVQEAFIEANAFQCGFCTPGFIMMVNKLLEANPNPTTDQIKHYLVGNLCRCSSYPEIIKAVHIAAEKFRNAKNDAPPKR